MRSVIADLLTICGAIATVIPLFPKGRSRFAPHYIDCQAVEVEPFEVTNCDLKAIPGKIVDDVADTLVFNEDMNDFCLGCPAKSGLECIKCPHLLTAWDRIPIEAPPAPMPSVRIAPMSPTDSANAFVAWLRENNRTGRFSDKQLKDTYQQFCNLNNRHPTAENRLRAKMKLIPGVTSQRVYTGAGRRNQDRGVTWFIDEEKTAPRSIVDLIPTLRRAA